MAVLPGKVVNLAKRCARADGSASFKTAHMLAGVLANAEARAPLGDLFMDGGEVVVPLLLSALVEKALAGPRVGEKLPLDGSFKVIFQAAYEETGGMSALRLLLPRLLACDDEAARALREANPGLRPEGSKAPPRPATWRGRLTEEVNALQNALARQVIGQRRAVQQSADAIFQARVYGRDSEHTPSAVRTTRSVSSSWRRSKRPTR